MHESARLPQQSDASVENGVALDRFEIHGDRSAPYWMSFDRISRFLDLELNGLWDRQTFDAFSDDYLALIYHASATGGVHHQLVDTSRFATQDPAVGERFPELIRRALGDSGVRCACVVPGIVERVRARPGADLINARYFRTREDAVAWLFSDEA